MFSWETFPCESLVPATCLSSFWEADYWGLTCPLLIGVLGNRSPESLLRHPKQFSTSGGIELGEGFDEGKELGFLLGI